MRSFSQTLITGVYRSGTEYVTQLIGSHPAISATMYRVNVLRFCCGRFDPIDQPDRWLSALDEIDRRLQSRYSLSLDRHAIESDLSTETRVTYGVLYDAVMTSLYLRNGMAHWAEKCQLLWREIPRFLEMMPNGRAILVMRDPRSIVASFRQYTYAPKPAYLGAIFNSVDAMNFGRQFEQDLPKDRFMIVRYEDAARDPSGACQKLHAFLGLPAEIDLRSRSDWQDAYGRPWSTNSAFHAGNDARPFNLEASIHRWKSTLSAEEIGLTETVCGAVMPSFGYETSGMAMNWPEALRLFAADDVITTYFRRWITTGEGVEAFPSDPLEPSNWRRE